MPFVYSTLTNDTNYAVYAYDTALANGHKNARKVKDIIIKGGTNVAKPMKRNVGDPETPIGVRTEVSETERDELLQNDVFLGHVDRGFIRIDNKKIHAEKAASKMDVKDLSRPRTPETDKEARLPVAQVN